MPLAAVLKNVYFSKLLCDFIKIRRDIAREMTFHIMIENWFHTETALELASQLTRGWSSPGLIQESVT